MKKYLTKTLLLIAFWPGFWPGAGVAEPLPTVLDQNGVVLLGEVHDNPHHHAVQSEMLTRIAPKAVVFEMLTPEQASRVTPELRGNRAALEAALGWSDSGWPDFAMYYPLFATAPGAVIYGAQLPRGEARKAMSQGVATYFGPRAGAFGLDTPLAPDEQSAREEYQHLAHCEAMPEEMLAGMVDLQRLRDAMLARAVVDALAETGGPVAVITGNGHARRDWGVPVYLQRVLPGVMIHALGQSEDGNGPEGRFDALRDSPAAERPDPCEAFRKS
ncbi:MAG: hypothetical protein CSA70_05660 [Rhodobacterales bacterium]|nr:MAG: hypothetical protein CSA70_05660 [Rhodobacterales bacterium]